MRCEIFLLLTLVKTAVIRLLLASWLLHLHRIHVCHIDIVNVLLILLLHSNVCRTVIRVFWAASAIASSTTSTGASRAISTIVFVVMHGRSLVADAAHTTLTASTLIADVSTRIREVGLITVS
jgi:hypothetical protein